MRYGAIINGKNFIMAKRIVTKIGNIFGAEIDGKYANIDGKYKVYFQYIANDISQLNS